MTAMDKPTSVSYDSTSATYGVLETSGIVNIFRISCIYCHMKRSQYVNERLIC